MGLHDGKISRAALIEEITRSHGADKWYSASAVRFMIGDLVGLGEFASVSRGDTIFETSGVIDVYAWLGELIHDGYQEHTLLVLKGQGNPNSAEIHFLEYTPEKGYKFL